MEADELYGTEEQGNIYTPSELNHEARLHLEAGFGRIWVEGEISNIARPASGHVYFSLKDEKAQKNLDKDGRIVKESLSGVTYASHYPSSKTGMALAEALSARLAEETGLPARIFPSSAYVLTNTACPAVLIRPVSVDSIERENKLRSAAFLRASAKKILEGLADVVGK